MSKETVINWGKFALIATAIMGAGPAWDLVRSAVNISNTPARQAETQADLESFEHECRTNFWNINVNISEIKNQLNTLNDTIHTKQ